MTRADYADLFESCVVRPERREVVEHTITTILRGKARYQAVTREKIPWYFVGIVHALESSSNFARHLHNGDPLTKRTVNVPAGRPFRGEPPFTWEQSAEDALAYMGLYNPAIDWSIPNGILWRFEAYNGFGYRKRNVPSPYLWSGSEHYTSGKFVVDGVFSPTAVSRQIGAAVLLRRMVDQSLI